MKESAMKLLTDEIISPPRLIVCAQNVAYTRIHERRIERGGVTAVRLRITRHA